MREMAKMESYYNIKSSLWWQASYSVLTGFIGSLLLVLLLTGLMSIGATVRYLPWILAFNASVSGYTFLDRSLDRLKHKKTSGAGVGCLVALLACAALNMLTFKMTGVVLMGTDEMAFFLIIASGFAGFGAWLAIAYSKIKNR